MLELRTQYQKQIEELSETSKRMAALGYVSSHGGNISYRVAEDVVLITPTKVPKRKIEFNDVCIINMKGEVLYAAPGRKPTGETPFHLRIYQQRPDVTGIVHGHPPVMTGFAIAHTDLLEKPLLPEPCMEVGPMLMVPYGEPLSQQLAEHFDSVIHTANGFLMKNHGALMVSSEGVERALDFLEIMENTAISALVAKLLGGCDLIPREEVGNIDRTIATRNLPMPGLPGTYSSLLDAFKE